MTTDPHCPDPPLPPAFEAELVVYSAREQARTFAVPAGFADRVSERFAARVRFIRRVKWATAVGLVALTAGVGYFATREPHVPVVNTPPQPVRTEPPPKLGESLSEAGEALASLSRDTAEKTVAPTRSIFGTVERLRVPTADVDADLTPATQSFAAMPTAAKSSLEPLTNNTRRAINLFLRDTGLQTSN